jgi:hypothetical protein
MDMYIKIESMRLDWYSNPENQKLIRAELYQVTTHIILFIYLFLFMNYATLLPCFTEIIRA